MAQTQSGDFGELVEFLNRNYVINQLYEIKMKLHQNALQEYKALLPTVKVDIAQDPQRRAAWEEYFIDLDRLYLFEDRLLIQQKVQIDKLQEAYNKALKDREDYRALRVAGSQTN